MLRYTGTPLHRGKSHLAKSQSGSTCFCTNRICTDIPILIYCHLHPALLRVDEKFVRVCACRRPFVQVASNRSRQLASRGCCIEVVHNDVSLVPLLQIESSHRLCRREKDIPGLLHIAIRDLEGTEISRYLVAHGNADIHVAGLRLNLNVARRNEILDADVALCRRNGDAGLWIKLGDFLQVDTALLRANRNRVGHNAVQFY
mmetsp:Transcript_44009/g.105382  ORF Transcript_44009/g.105382 Transcript_44009/m.105382 type:complete len:202 (+) Transcript_44009:166-771(+)